MGNNLWPFLGRPFAKKIAPNITEGWIYSKEEVEVHGKKHHNSIDFAVPTGTPILAAADGMAVASFTEAPVTGFFRKHKLWRGKPVFYGAGLVVKIFHQNGWCTLYGHLHELAKELVDAKVYYPPLDDHGSLISQNLRVPATSIGETIRALPVKAGQIIGYSGITGMGWGERTYEKWLAGKQYEACDEEHLHFQVIHNEPDTMGEYASLDPFGLYKDFREYPDHKQDWSKLSNSLWIA